MPLQGPSQSGSHWRASPRFPAALITVLTCGVRSHSAALNCDASASASAAGASLSRPSYEQLVTPPTPPSCVPRILCDTHPPALINVQVEITCTPSTGVRANQNLIVHHTLNVSWKRDHSYDVFLDMHRGVTCAQAALTPENAAAEIERVLSECVRLCLPVYFSIPAEVCALPAARPASGYATGRILPLASDPEALSQAIRLISDWCVITVRVRPRIKNHTDILSVIQTTRRFPLTCGWRRLPRCVASLQGQRGGAAGDPR